MDIEDYERDCAEKKLLMKLQEAEEAVQDGERWLSLDELKAFVVNKMMLQLELQDIKTAGLNISDKSFKVLKLENNKITLEEEV